MMWHFIRDYTVYYDKQSSEKVYNFYWEIVNCDPSIYTMEHPKFIVSNLEEESISAKRVECLSNRQSIFGIDLDESIYQCTKAK